MNAEYHKTFVQNTQTDGEGLSAEDKAEMEELKKKLDDAGGATVEATKAK